MALLPLYWSAAGLQAQARVEIGDAPTCGTCDLTLHLVATIHDRDGSAGMRAFPPQSVLRTAAGTIFVVTANPFEVFLFDPSGRFVRKVGREGEGPGEFRTPRSVVPGMGDTIWVIDISLRRRTAWSPTGDFLGVQHPIPGSLFEALVLPDRTWVASGPVMTAASIGLPMHRLGPGGDVVQSFGPEEDVDPTGHTPGWIRRSLTHASDGRLWAARRHEYAIELFGSEGDLLSVVERNAPWFPHRDPRTPRNLAEEGPAVVLSSVRENRPGLLTAILGMPGEDWRSGLGERELQPGFEEAGVYWTPVRDFHAVFRFAVEVMDIDRRELLLREHFSGMNVGWADSNHLVTYDQDEFDVPIIQVHRVEFRDTRERPR